MKIGHYMVDIWARGGVASYIRGLTEAQRKTGHEVVFFDTASPDASTAAEWMPISVGAPADLYRRAGSLGLDMLHLHTSVSCAPPRGMPIVRTVHGHSQYCPSGGRYLKRSDKPCDRSYGMVGCLWGHLAEHCGTLRPHGLVREFQRTRDELTVLRDMPVIAISQFQKREMIRAGYRAGGIDVLQPFAPRAPDFVPPPVDGMPRFAFLGRLAPQKGLSWLLEAVASLPLPVHLDVAGAGDLEGDLRALVRRRGLADRVTFHGWVGGARARQILERSRALIFPSLWHEPAGLVALEAMAHGRPVIASSVGGIPEIVCDRVSGLLVESGDVNGLARCIGTLAQDVDLATVLGKGGLRLVHERYQLSDHLRYLTALYHHVRAETAQRAPSS